MEKVDLDSLRRKWLEAESNVNVSMKETLALWKAYEKAVREARGEVVGSEGWDKFRAGFEAKHPDWFNGKTVEEKPDSVSTFYRDRAKVMSHVKDFKIVSAEPEIEEWDAREPEVMDGPEP